jgi:molecular chaperone DnaK (HSP70)
MDVGGATLGIDFGTSHTVAVLHRERMDTLLFDASPLLPSGVFADADGRLLVGRDAQRSARLDPAAYEPNPKRRIDETALLLGSAELPLVQAVAAVLGRVRAEAERVLGAAPARVVLTHPAGGDAGQRADRRRRVLRRGPRSSGSGRRRRRRVRLRRRHLRHQRRAAHRRR